MVILLLPSRHYWKVLASGISRPLIGKVRASPRLMMPPGPQELRTYPFPLTLKHQNS
jgi:hypothetical protein